MELDDLKTIWRELDRRLDASLDLQRSLYREVKLGQTRSALRGLSGVLVLELLSGVLAAVLMGAFLAGHIDAARFAVPAVVLHAVAVLTIAISARQLWLIGRIDYAAPVVAIQHQIADVRASRLRSTRWLLLLSPLLWTPLAIVAAKGLFGVDVCRAFGPVWVAANLAVGVAVIPIGVWVSRRMTARAGRSGFVARLADLVAGRSLTSARDQLEEVARFERER